MEGYDRAIGDLSKIVGVERGLVTEEVLVLVERLGDVVGEAFRRIIPGINVARLTHDRGDFPEHSPEITDRKNGAFQMVLRRQRREHGLRQPDVVEVERWRR